MRRSVLTREAQINEAAVAARYERVWLFHGTDEDTVPKICHRWVPPLTPTLALVIAISLNLTLTLTLTRTLTLTLNLTLTLTLNFILTLTRTLTRCPRSARWASTARSAVS